MSNDELLELVDKALSNEEARESMWGAPISGSVTASANQVEADSDRPLLVAAESTAATQEYDDSGASWIVRSSDDESTILVDRREGSRRRKKAPARLTYDRLGEGLQPTRATLRSQSAYVDVFLLLRCYIKNKLRSDCCACEKLFLRRNQPSCLLTCAWALCVGSCSRWLEYLNRA